MTNKNRKARKNPIPKPGTSTTCSSNVPATGQPSVSCAQLATSKPAKPASNPAPSVSSSTSQNKPNIEKPVMQANLQKPANQSNNLKKDLSNLGGQAKCLDKGNKTNGKAKSGGQSSQPNKKKSDGNKVPVKSKPPKLLAAQLTVKEQIKVSNFNHAPADTRLKFSILFKQESAFYSPEIIQTPLLKYQFKSSREGKNQYLEISRSIDQLVAQDKINDIVNIITTILDNNNPLLINYDVLLYALAKSLFLVKQDPKAKLASPTIIDFRAKILALAVDRVSGSNAEYLLQFVFYIVHISKKLLQNTAVRLALQKWYLLKPADKLVLLCAKCSTYQGVTHAFVLKTIHFSIPACCTDSQLALLSIVHGFGLISTRVVTGSFPKDAFIPNYLSNYECYTKADDKIKALIKDIALVRSPDSTQKPVAAAVKAHGLSMKDVNAKFNRSFQVNSAAIEISSQRQLLRAMNGLRMHNLLVSTDEVEFEDVATAATYAKRLSAEDSLEPALHPPEVLSAYAKYVLAPQVISDYSLHNVKSQESGDQPEEVIPKKPQVCVVKALEALYTKSFENLEKHDINMVVCIDLQDKMASAKCRNFKPLRGYHECMLILQCLIHMVKDSSNIKVFAFKDKKLKPLHQLKKHLVVPNVEKAESEKDENDCENDMETWTDTESPDGEEKLEDNESVDVEKLEDSENENSIVNELENHWQHYRKQVTKTRGITVHQLFTLSAKWAEFLPDLFVFVCLQENLSLYKANTMFKNYMKSVAKKNAKLLIISPCSHLHLASRIHRRNMLHIVGYDEKVTHLIEDFIADKIFPPVEHVIAASAASTKFEPLSAVHLRPLVHQVSNGPIHVYGPSGQLIVMEI